MFKVKFLRQWHSIPLRLPKYTFHKVKRRQMYANPPLTLRLKAWKPVIYLFIFIINKQRHTIDARQSVWLITQSYPIGLRMNQTVPHRTQFSPIGPLRAVLEHKTNWTVSITNSMCWNCSVWLTSPLESTSYWLPPKPQDSHLLFDSNTFDHWCTREFTDIKRPMWRICFKAYSLHASKVCAAVHGCGVVSTAY